jgi:nitrogen-specific signal transduction histidine kinase
VSENGKTFKKAVKKQLFKPFFTTKTEGTGLGLYTSKLLTEKDNGRIIMSRKNNKTVFTGLYPIADNLNKTKRLV